MSTEERLKSNVKDEYSTHTNTLLDGPVICNSRGKEAYSAESLTRHTHNIVPAVTYSSVVLSERPVLHGPR